jgi:Ser/Thr protein kinase RdoA (MazF antagonist)
LKDFYQLTTRGQALRLRHLALVALERYDLDVKRVRLVTNETNGIFRVDTPDGQKVILRVSDPKGCHALDEIRSEMMWLAALRRDTDLGVPQPLATRTGALVTTVETTGVPEPRHCVVFSWLPGSDLADRFTPENAYRFGAFSALLHDHAASFTPPPGFRVRTLDRVFPYTDSSFPFVEPVVLFDAANQDLLPPQRRQVFQRATARVQAALDELYADETGLRVTHNDLHQWNVKVHRGKLYGFDFEDLAWGYPVQDVATTLYYIEGLDHKDELIEAFRRGYTSHSEWPERHPGQIATFMRGRNLMLVNYVLCAQDLDYRQMAPRYLARAERRLQEFLDQAQS